VLEAKSGLCAVLRKKDGRERIPARGTAMIYLPDAKSPTQAGEPDAKRGGGERY
jgi:hypothetical protein